MKPVKVLLIEDDPGHALLIEKNLRRAHVSNEFVRFQDGQEALDFIFSHSDRSIDSEKTSYLVLLDLNLPGMDG